MTAVDQFQAETEAVATATEREVVGIYTQLAAGLIAREAAVLLIAAAVNRANAVAVTLGDVWLAVQIEELAGQPVPTVGIAPRDHSERLVKAARTILFDDDTDAEPVTDEEVDEDSNDGPIGRLTRLARAEPLETAQQAVHDATTPCKPSPSSRAGRGRWTPIPANSLPMVVRDGRIWPKEHPFQHHKGCNCQPKIVLAEHIRSTQITRLERNAS